MEDELAALVKQYRYGFGDPAAYLLSLLSESDRAYPIATADVPAAL